MPTLQAPGLAKRFIETWIVRGDSGVYPLTLSLCEIPTFDAVSCRLRGLVVNIH